MIHSHSCDSSLPITWQYSFLGNSIGFYPVLFFCSNSFWISSNIPHPLPLYSVLFYITVYRTILFYSILFYSIFYSLLCHLTWFLSFIFYRNLFSSIKHSILDNSITLCSLFFIIEYIGCIILFYSTFYSILYSVQCYFLFSILLCNILLCSAQ